MTSTETTTTTSGHRVRFWVLWLVDLLKRSVLLFPRALAAMLLLAVGRTDRAQARLLGVDPGSVALETAGRGRLWGAGLLVAPMGLVALLGRSSPRWTRCACCSSTG